MLPCLTKNMRRLIPALITLCTAFLAACQQIDDEMYTVYDVYYETAFITDSTNAVLSCAAKPDTPEKIWDVWIKVKGGFEYESSDIQEYGLCWIKGKGTPGSKGSETHYVPNGGYRDDEGNFYSDISGLECETEYTVCSYVKTKDGRIGYNPNVLYVTTDHPHDKWFESQGFLNHSIIAGRSDCVNIMTVIDGDTLTFFGMGRAGDRPYNDMWCYSSKKKTYEQIAPVKSRTGEIMALWGAVGFVINYVENDIAHHLLYIGCGCSKPSGDIKMTDYNKKFFVYDIDTRQWEEVTYLGDNHDILLKEPFPGEVRTGGIGFAIREWGFIGLGEFQNGSTTHYHKDIYLFMMAKDENKQYSPTSGYFNQMTADFGFGKRSGASVVVVEDNAYIIGGVGSVSKENGPEEKVYYDDFIPCHFTMPINSRPDSYTFSWPHPDKIRHFNDNFLDENGEGYNFKSRAYASVFSVDGSVYYGMGEGVDENGKKEYYSDMIKYDLKVNYIPKLCTPYTNADSRESRVSRATVINSGDRVFVVGGETADEGNDAQYSSSEWVYRP